MHSTLQMYIDFRTSLFLFCLLKFQFPRDYLTLPAIKSQDLKTYQFSRPRQQPVPLRPLNERSYYKTTFMVKPKKNYPNVCKNK